MNAAVRNILAVIFGILIGSLVNMGVITLGAVLVPLPAGADTSTMEALRDSMKLFLPINFLVPFLAHALGTLCGAFIAYKIAICRRMQFALGIGLFFLLGGAAAISMIGGPLWFSVLDLAVAYFPMAYLGGLLARGKQQVSDLATA